MDTVHKTAGFCNVENTGCQKLRRSLHSQLWGPSHSLLLCVIWFAISYDISYVEKCNCNCTRILTVFSCFLSFIPKKVELLILFFAPLGRSRVFHFFLRTFGEVAGHPGPLEASDETYAQSKIDISGSDETIQNALALIVKHCAFNIIFLPLHDSLIRWNCFISRLLLLRRT